MRLPEGKKIAVSIGPDFDAQSIWMGTFGKTTQGYLARGEFAAEVGVPRVLDLFQRFDVRTTWCVPSHTLLTFPAQCELILSAGHEIAAHGVYHESINQVDCDEERRLLELQIKHHTAFTGSAPAGYRSPSWDHTDHTLGLLEEFGFSWDSSLMARDFTPYWPRPVAIVDREAGNVFGPESPVIELPVSWFLDDFPALESLPRSIEMQSTDVVLQRWIDHFDFAYQRVDNPAFILTVHPETVGRAHAYLMLERFLQHVTSHDGVWFAPLSEIASQWASSHD